MVLFEDNENIIYSNSFDGYTTTFLKFKKAYKGTIVRAYIYQDIEEYKHPKLSWQNLSYICGGYDEENILPKLVVEGKKLVSNVVLKNEDLYSDFKNDNVELVKNKGKHGYIDYYFIAKGKLRDYFNFEEIIEHYNKLTNIFNNDDEFFEDDVEENLRELNHAFNYDIKDLILGKFKGYDWVSPDDCYNWQTVLTGLLLGYPLESTASIINGN